MFVPRKCEHCFNLSATIWAEESRLMLAIHCLNNASVTDACPTSPDIRRRRIATMDEALNEATERMRNHMLNSVLNNEALQIAKAS
jgi:hypothetical protein